MQRGVAWAWVAFVFAAGCAAPAGVEPVQPRADAEAELWEPHRYEGVIQAHAGVKTNSATLCGSTGYRDSQGQTEPEFWLPSAANAMSVRLTIEARPDSGPFRVCVYHSDGNVTKVSGTPPLEWVEPVKGRTIISLAVEPDGAAEVAVVTPFVLVAQALIVGSD